MKFDESKIYTMLNADKVKPGSIGYLADTIAILKEKLADNANPDTLIRVDTENAAYRFFGVHTSYLMFYLIEEPNFRPFKNTEELLKTLKCSTGLTMPGIWVKDSNDTKSKYLIAGFSSDKVLINDYWRDFSELLERYTFLDGSPCGVKG